MPPPPPGPRLVFLFFFAKQRPEARPRVPFVPFTAVFVRVTWSAVWMARLVRGNLGMRDREFAPCIAVPPGRGSQSFYTNFVPVTCGRRDPFGAIGACWACWAWGWAFPGPALGCLDKGHAGAALRKEGPAPSNPRPGPGCKRQEKKRQTRTRTFHVHPHWGSQPCTAEHPARRTQARSSNLPSWLGRRTGSGIWENLTEPEQSFLPAAQNCISDPPVRRPPGVGRAISEEPLMRRDLAARPAGL